MSNYNEEVGIRLRSVREIMNEGKKLTADQFAHLLEETGDRVRNYELGRTPIPIRLLKGLYDRGINPVYLLAGEGNVFADNAAGQKFQEIVEKRGLAKVSHLKVYSAAAGKIE